MKFDPKRDLSLTLDFNRISCELLARPWDVTVLNAILIDTDTRNHHFFCKFYILLEIIFIHRIHEYSANICKFML